MRNDEIYHWGLKKGSKSDDHKYIERITLPNGKYKYVYKNAATSNKKPINGQTIRSTVNRNINRMASGRQLISGNFGSRNNTNKKNPWNTAKERVSKAVDNTRERASKVVDNTRERASKVVDNVQDKATKAAIQVSNAMKRELGIIGKNVLKKGEQAVSDMVKKQGSGTKEEAKDKDKKPTESQNDTKENYLSRLIHASSSVINEMTDKAQSIWEQAQSNTLDMLKKQKYTLSSEEDAALVNPYYDPYHMNQYTDNCSHCTLAYDMRRRGYDVEAAPSNNGEGETIDTILSWYKNATAVSLGDTFSNYQKNHPDLTLDKFNKMSEKQQIDVVKNAYKEELSSYGPGARGNFAVTWSSGGGHSVVWEVEKDGSVSIIDCQNNTRYKIEDYEWEYISNVSYVRTDNLELTDAAAKNVINKDNDYKNPVRNGDNYEINTNLQPTSNDGSITNVDYYYDKNGNRTYYTYQNGDRYVYDMSAGVWRKA